MTGASNNIRAEESSSPPGIEPGVEKPSQKDESRPDLRESPRFGVRPKRLEPPARPPSGARRSRIAVRGFKSGRFVVGALEIDADGLAGFRP